ncbi:MAG TPA: DUF6782 family putative metallopeptidase [Actinomycetota bacterium]|nr:DUF6782 family putative metallopeptidase [Actinomycetota bacterium]
MHGDLGRAARNSFGVVVVIAALASLIFPYRMITERIQELARERIASDERGVPLPPEWEAAVDELKAFVEAERGLSFKRDVPVVVEPEEKFQERLAEEAEAYGSIDPADSYIALKALHLVDRRLDLESSEDPLRDGGTLGYYDAYTNRLVVQGKRLTPFVRQILVHELTHALQDQHFNLDRELNEFDESYLAFEALVEGDATRIENRYLESIPADERNQAAAEENAGVPQLDQEPNDSLQTLSMLSGFAYEVGDRFATEVFSAGGQERLDKAFVSPPTTTEQVLHPERFLTLQKPVKVPRPKAEGDVYEEGVWGERGLLTLLLRNLPEEQAWAAADGWAGDYYVAWKEGGRSCVRLSVVTDSRADKEELVLALRSWALQQRLVSIAEGKTIQVRSCD